MEWQKPDVGQSVPISIPQTTDEFNTDKLSPQWQWHANPRKGWFSLTKNPGHLRLYAVQKLSQNGNLWLVPNLLLQKFPAPSFTVTTKINFKPDQPNEKSGLVIMGKEWAFIAISKTNDGLQMGMYNGTYYQGYDKTKLNESIDIQQNACYLKVHVDNQAICTFSYSLDGENYQHLGNKFTAAKGTWIGAKAGLFNVNPNITDSKGYADFDWFKFE